MPRGRWIIFVAVVGLGLGGNVQPVNDRGNSQRPAGVNQQDKNREASIRAARVERLRALNKARTDEQHAAEERQRGRDDLKAQQDTALWTKVMGMVALAALALSAFGIWLIYTTFKETRRNANAAEKAISETTRIGEAQVKSYMTVTKGFIRLGGDGTVSVRLEVKNSGQSPARSVRFESWTTLAPLSGEIQQQFRTTVEDLAMPVASQMKAKLPPQTAPDKMKKEILDALIDGKPVAVTLSVMLHWRDVFRGKPTQGASFSTIISEWMIDEYQELPFAEHMIAAFRHETIRRKRPKEEGGESA